MPTRAEWATQPLDNRIERLARTPDEIHSLIRARSDAELSHRPDSKNWAVKEIVCHLRDIEELAMLRHRMMLAMDEPKVPAAFLPADRPGWGLIEDEATLVDPDRWADERQYLRSDPALALAAFRRRREETLAFLGRLDAISGVGSACSRPSVAWRSATGSRYSRPTTITTSRSSYGRWTDGPDALSSFWVNGPGRT